MICPKCEAEYVKGITVCPDCGVELIPEEKYEGHLVHPSDWITIYTTDASFEADMLKANLEGAGIETLVLSQKDQNFPVTGNLAVIKVMVKKENMEAALEILNDINREDPEDTVN